MYKKFLLSIFLLQFIGWTGCNLGGEVQTITPTPDTIQHRSVNIALSTFPSYPPLRPMGPAGSWKLIFADEFDSTSLDKNFWQTCYWWNKNGCTISTNSELEWYLPQNVTVHDGMLVLEARKQEVMGSGGKSYSYTSGMVSTGYSTSDRTQTLGFAFKYGFIEIRARIPSGQGLWPAFWMLPVTEESTPEIDIMEILGNEPRDIKMNLHYTGNAGEKVNVGKEWVGPDFSEDWHTFGLDWEPDYISWYVDGVERYRFSDPSFVPAEPMYAIINLAVGGNWPGSPDASTNFPSRFKIDFVRAWKRSG